MSRTTVPRIRTLSGAIGILGVMLIALTTVAVASVVVLPQLEQRGFLGSTPFTSTLGVNSGDIFEGEFEVVILDDFETPGYVAQYEYFLRDNKGQSRRVEVSRMNKERLAELKTGDKVKIRGSENKKKEVEAADIQVTMPAPEMKPVVQYDETGAPAVVTDERRAVVLLVNLSNMNQAATISSVTSIMYTGAQNVDNFYRTATRGLIGFKADTDGNGTPDIFGPFGITADSSNCDFNTWGNQADAVATQSGIDLSRYQHRIYVVPKTSSCTYAGYASGGGGTYSRAWIFQPPYLDLWTHELGHNLDMFHASTDSDNNGTNDNEYGDLSDVMGRSGYPVRYFNAANDFKNGWAALYPNKTVSVIGSGEFTLAPISTDPATSPHPQILKIPKKGSATEFYFVSFRKAEGLDASLGSTYTAGANIHRSTGAKGGYTYHIKTLSTGGIWTDPLGSGLSITQLEKAADNSFIRVRVDIQTVCTPQAPTVTLSPASQSSDGTGGAFTFSVNVLNNDETCNATVFTPRLTPTSLTGTFTPVSSSLAAGTAQSFTLSVAVPTTSGTYPFSVTMADTDGVNPTHAEVSATGQIIVDSQAPTAPTLSATQNTKQGTVTLSWTGATDNVAVTKYEVLRNGVLLTSVPGTSYTDKPSATGNYTYFVRARDAANNASPESNQVSVSVTVKGGGKPPRR